MSVKIDTSRVVGNVPSSLQCPICLNILWYEHVVTPPCEHWVCEDCYDRWFLERSSQCLQVPKCPVCKDDQWSTKKICKNASRILNDVITIKCRYAAFGCTKTFQYGDELSHELECVCTACDCIIENEDHQCLISLYRERKNLKREVEELETITNDLQNVIDSIRHREGGQPCRQKKQRWYISNPV
jgi:hypothetical protein